ncbi:MAG: ABC transporter permease, partial [Methyloligellaceae bacterium]
MKFAPVVRPLTGRFLHSVVTLWLVTLVFFALTDLLPGDFATATATRDTTREQVESLQHELGLFTSAPKRYVVW